jgi:murein DD-endopeptidase MepM/ murein hydrolase activator NlpD
MPTSTATPTGCARAWPLRRGDVIGYVGTTGNAAPNAPHLPLRRLSPGPERRWWKGEAVNPFGALR